MDNPEDILLGSSEPQWGHFLALFATNFPQSLHSGIFCFSFSQQS